MLFGNRETGIKPSPLCCGFAGLVLLLAAGCAEREVDTKVPLKTSDASEPDTEPEGTESGSDDQPAVTGGELKTFGQLRFRVPEGWEEIPLTAMQQGFVTAKLGVPAVDDELSISLSTSGGSIEDNINRWRGQFSGGGEDTESIRVNGSDAQMIDLHGAYQGMAAPPQSGWRMIGVIVPLPGRADHYFIKLTGPMDSVETIGNDFTSFVKSAESP